MWLQLCSDTIVSLFIAETLLDKCRLGLRYNIFRNKTSYCEKIKFASELDKIMRRYVFIDFIIYNFFFNF